MMGRQDRQKAMVFVDMESLIPENHLLEYCLYVQDATRAYLKNYSIQRFAHEQF